jgi:hypothetical protein
MSRAGNLFRLQEMDLELDAHRARLEAIAGALSGDPAVQAAHDAVVEAEARFNAARVEVRGLEHDGQTLDEKIADVDKRLYGGGVTHPKELQDLQKDLQSLKRQRAAAEEKQLEALIRSEEAEAQKISAQTRLQKAEAEAAQMHRDLIEEQARLQARAAQFDEARAALLTRINAQDRDLYERLRRAKNGRPVSQLEDGVCTACGVAPSSSRIQNARHGNELIRCGNCERILYAE